MAMYFLFMLPGMLLMMWAQSKVKGSYAKYSQMRNDRNISGAEAARIVLDANGLQSVPIQIDQRGGDLTDHYDPRSRTLVLSQKVYRDPSIASIAVAAHEAGHAIQHAKGYAPLRTRTAIVPLVTIGSNLGMMVIIAGVLMQMTGMAWLGIALFSLSTIFALVTLPVDFDASKRAKLALVETGIVDGGVAGGAESKAVDTMLDSAAWTYVAGFAASLMTLLYYVMLVSGQRRE